MALAPRTPTADLPARLAAAEALCRARGARLTEMRREVYAMLLDNAAPLAAYDLMARLDRKLDRRLAPPTVYRALEFLLAHGLIHRLESTNAYMPCVHPGEAHESVYFLCSRCGSTAEVADTRIGGLIHRGAQDLHFKPTRQVVEVQGLCEDCDEPAPARRRA
ncbi:MAG TPA: transcriptional repressor [Nevskiaceae bacterium]|nr:transcriptional repressor [Nevskiaceae bacterium]